MRRALGILEEVRSVIVSQERRMDRGLSRQRSGRVRLRQSSRISLGRILYQSRHRQSLCKQARG